MDLRLISVDRVLYNGDGSTTVLYVADESGVIGIHEVDYYDHKLAMADIQALEDPNHMYLTFAQEPEEWEADL